jgi:diaphanous 2
MSAMVLINALISHAETVEFKIHLRSDFNRCGLISTLDNLKKTMTEPEEQFLKQIQVFEKCAKQNFEELELNFEQIQSTWEGELFELALNLLISMFFQVFFQIDTKGCFEYLQNSVKDTPTEVCLLSILQHLMVIREDVHVK